MSNNSSSPSWRGMFVTIAATAFVCWLVFTGKAGEFLSGIKIADGDHRDDVHIVNTDVADVADPVSIRHIGGAEGIDMSMWKPVQNMRDGKIFFAISATPDAGPGKGLVGGAGIVDGNKITFLKGGNGRSFNAPEGYVWKKQTHGIPSGVNGAGFWEAGLAE